MRYLVIGDANSMHIFNFVKTVLLPKNFEIHLLTLSARKIKDEYLSFYLKNKIFVHSIAEKKYKNLEKKDIFHRFLNITRKFRLIRDIPKIDICHVQSVYKTALLMILKNKKKFKNVILSYWGGDIEDRSKYVVNLRKKCFKFANVITVTVKQTYNDFQNIYGNEFNNKLYICRFATETLDYINQLSKVSTKEECKKAYDIPKDKICITCGYSAYASQHQDLCLEIINRLDSNLKKKIFVIIPMQYGRFDTEYINRVKNIANQCDFPCKILENFVPFEMSAKLAISTDIYLHLRDTDAFSNALKEHVYSNSYIIKGDWLKYIELEEMKANIISINSFDQLLFELKKAINSICPYNKINLFEPIYQLYSKKAIIDQWNKIIEISLSQNI